MRQFYEDFWADAPEDGEPYAWDAAGAGCLSARCAPATGCSTTAAAAGASSRCSTTRPAWRSPRRRPSGRARPSRAPTSACLEADGTIPFGHGEFDLVWCSEVLEHIPDVSFALGEIRRVLKPGGRALLTVPFHGRVQAAWIALTRFEAHFDPFGQHVRFFTRTVAC